MSQSATTDPELGQRAVRGGLTTLSGQGGKILVQIASVVVLSRLLSPEDYGLLAMVTAVIGVADIFRDFGLSSAAIQARTLSRGAQTNLFWANTVIGIVLGVLVFAGSPLLARIYDEPALVPIAHALAVSFVLNGLATQYRADLSRRLRFGRLAIADVGAAVLALGAAIGCALLGAGYWSLVVQQLVQVGVALALAAVFAGWLPGRVRRQESIRPFLTFGWKLAGANLVNYAGNNVDSLIIGTRFGAAPLGLYNRSFQLLMTPLGQIRGPLSNVAIPILSRLQDDPERYDTFVRRGQLVMGYTIVVGLAVVVGAVEPVVGVFLGPQWQAAAPILRFLAVAGIFQTLAYVGYWVYVSRGLTGDLFGYSIISAGIRVVAILVGSLWGVLGVAAGYAVAPMLAWSLSLWWLSRRTRFPARDLMCNGLKLVAVAIWVAGTAALGSWIGREWLPILRLLLGLAGGAVGAALVFTVVGPVRRDLALVLGTVRRGLRERGAR